MRITFDEIKKNKNIETYIKQADLSLVALGFTEHSFAHVMKVSSDASDILTKLNYSEHEIELVKIAGYMHDIGNVINRIDHAQSGATMAFSILNDMKMDAEDIAVIITAIGNHDEGTAFPVNAVAAALILADKTDVRRSRVRNRDTINFDIHDRVNYAVTSSKAEVDLEKKKYILDLEIDTDICTAMDYFEIFMGRMLLCRRAAEFFGLKFGVVMNGTKML